MDEFQAHSQGRIMGTIGWIDGGGHATHWEESAWTAVSDTGSAGTGDRGTPVGGGVGNVI